MVFRSRALRRFLKYFIIIGVILFATKMLIENPQDFLSAKKNVEKVEEVPPVKIPAKHAAVIAAQKPKEPAALENEPETKENHNFVDAGGAGGKDPELDEIGNSKEIDLSEYPKFVGPRLGNKEVADPGPRKVGIGERGDPVVLDASLDSAVKKSIAEWGFNMVASDKVSLDREPKDIRKEECKHWDYPPEEMMPTVSVVLVFHNEAWSTLMRTVHSVFNMTPKKILKEIVMIDDGSNKPHLGSQLEEYLVGKFDGKALLYRNGERHGLIRARCDGARKSTGDILIYLDAHCEAGVNWIYPLITPIMKDWSVTTCPLVDVIDGNKYTFTEQAGGDEDGHARGAWDWDLLWKRIPLTHREKNRRKHSTEPYRSPAMAGGLFAINREYFFHIGLYDEELEIWGGENFEISYKLWQCGGKLLFVPCSRVGHVYRLPGWHGNPAPRSVHANFAMRNYVRVIEVWWGDYKKYFYERRPEAKHVDPGDLTKARKLFKDLKCKSFDWFMEEIAYDIPKRFPLVIPDNGAEGHLTMQKDSQWCLDGKHAGQGVAIGLSKCSTPGDTNFMLTWHEDIRQGRTKIDINKKKMCLDCVGKRNKVTLWECHHQGGNQLWKFDADTGVIKHALSQGCLAGDIGSGKISVEDCSGGDDQKWSWTTVNATQLKMFNSNPRQAVLVKEIDAL